MADKTQIDFLSLGDIDEAYRAGIEKGRQEVIEEIEAMDKRHTMSFILQALKEGKDV